jgi:TRAP-type mannitol/chloroaromatic compound transport system substrate-binding protein
MKRRRFVAGAGVAALGTLGTAGVFLSSPSRAATKRVLKMVTTWPKNFPGLGTTAERLAKRITEMSGGELSVKVFAAKELVPDFEAFDAVSNGTADLYHGAEYYWQGKSKSFNFFAAVPFGMTATEMAGWITFGGGQNLWDQLSARFNIKPFMAGNTSFQMGGWYNKEINTLEDWKGLSIRMPGLGGEVLRALGATAVSLPGGEVFAALQSGSIDATEWVGPWNDLAFGFHKIAKYYYYPGFHEPGTVLSAGVNLDVWESLSGRHKAIINAAMAAENERCRLEFTTKNSLSLDVLLDKHKVDLRKFSDEMVRAIARVSADVVEGIGNETPESRKIYQSFMAFREKSLAWSKISGMAFDQARLLSLES